MAPSEVAWPPLPEPPRFAAPHPEPVVHPLPASSEVATGAERLRLLRGLRQPGHAAGLGAPGRRRLLEALGGGWASRRALSAMIAGAGLDDLDEALALLDALDRDSRRTWCLVDLIEHWPLDAAERQRVLDRAPSDVARRRLERRLRRAASQGRGPGVPGASDGGTAPERR